MRNRRRQAGKQTEGTRTQGAPGPLFSNGRQRRKAASCKLQAVSERFISITIYNIYTYICKTYLLIYVSIRNVSDACSRDQIVILCMRHYEQYCGYYAAESALYQ